MSAVKEIPFVLGDTNDASYGIVFVSEFVHKIRRSRNREYPHRIKIWSNVQRKNPHPGSVRYTDFGSVGSDGLYLDPQNKGTNDPISVLASAEAMVIARGSFTGSAASGQVWGEELELGDVVVLRMPNGANLGTYVIEQKALHGPHLVPFVDATPSEDEPMTADAAAEINESTQAVTAPPE